ncbi:MAG: hypothetical protein SGBAC_012498, partial [Bacillariaceae sp.]
MAPREATGTFPDQFLTFDYDASMPMGMPPPHDPLPLGPVATMMDATEEEVTPPQDPLAGQHNISSDTSRPPTNAQVDPLSIDPTSNHLEHNNGNGRHTHTLPPQPQPQPPAANVSFGSTGTTVNSVRGNSATLPQNLPHLAVPRLQLVHQVSQVSLPPIEQNEQNEQQPQDEDEAPPALDMTFDSVASSNQSNQSNQSFHVVEDDEQSSSPQSASAISASSSQSPASLQETSAFDNSSAEPSSPMSVARPAPVATPASPSSINLSFGPNTTVSDLKYFAERGCIVALLSALNTPRLVTLGTRMLADYAKMSHRRVAVASNRRILEFVQRTMLHVSEHADWLGREYAVETVRSLTATEESDRYLMRTHGLLNTLALVARGGPFVSQVRSDGIRCTLPLASEKARLHACIAIMNLSCGKANKIEIAKIPDVLEAMREVMLHCSDEARLKATTCIKNLSNADANDAALLGTPGLVEALGQVAATT